MTVRPSQQFPRRWACLIAVAALSASLDAAAAPVALATSASVIAWATHSAQVAVSGQSNVFSPADLLAPFSISALAHSVDLLDPTKEALGHTSVVANPVSSAKGSVDMAIGWSTQNVVQGEITFGDSGSRYGWQYSFEADQDGIFVLDPNVVRDADTTNPQGIDHFLLWWDGVFVSFLEVGDGAPIQLAVNAGQTHDVMIQSFGGILGPLGTRTNGISGHFDWSIEAAAPPPAAVPEPASWALVTAGALGLASRRRRG